MAAPTPEEWMALAMAKARYCRTLDTKDWAGFAGQLAEDYAMEVVGGAGTWTASGRDDAMRQIRASMEHAISAHHVHSPQIDVDGDVAKVRWAMTDRVIWPEQGPNGFARSLIGYEHYDERWIRFDGGWRLAFMRLTRLHYDYPGA